MPPLRIEEVLAHLYKHNSQLSAASGKELYILTGTETFAKEPEFWKLFARAKVGASAVLLKKVHWFLSMSVTASLLRLGALLRDNFKWVLFPP